MDDGENEVDADGGNGVDDEARKSPKAFGSEAEQGREGGIVMVGEGFSLEGSSRFLSHEYWRVFHVILGMCRSNTRLPNGLVGIFPDFCTGR